jgi:serine/threonine protein kinase
MEVTASPFAHETEGLNRIKSLLPTVTPFRAWSNFEFRDDQGKWHEVDLLVLGRRRIHLVELKYYSGTIAGDDYRWLREGHRAEDSPLKLARRKAQRLAGKLRDELYRWAAEEGRRVTDARDFVPFVQEAVFLHHPQTRCVLPPASRIDLFGLDGKEAESGLPGISERLLEPTAPQQLVGAEADDLIPKLMARIGLVQRRQREVGSWMIDDAPVAEGRDWQDWPASHRVAGRERVRIRFHVTRPGAPEDDRRRMRLLAEHEYRIMSRLTHDGLLRPRDIVHNELGVGLVYPDDQAYQRLDLWLAEQAGTVTAGDQLAIVRQVAEALIYAHSNGVVHRGLTPAAVYVRRRAEGGVRVLVGDWQTAGRLGGRVTSATPSSGVTDLLGDSEGVDQALARDQALADQDQVDIDRRQAEAFQAPEGVWRAESDRVRLDVFALGALTYLVVTGRPPASDRHALRERLLHDDGLDLAADLPQVPSPLRAAVLAATRPTVPKRLPDVRSFLEPLAAAEGLLSSPDDEASLDPLEAAPGAIIAGRFQLERRLGAGSTAVALRVKDLSLKDGPDSIRVLKIAIDDSAARRLNAEAEVLTHLNSPRLVRMVEGPIEIGGRRTLVLESAGDETLAEAMRTRRRLSLDLLERWGDDILEALVALERAGVDHRDIKPANFGVREGRGDRVKHLILFDFSLSRAALAATRVGTPPYLDPFLESPGRKGYDTAAERYSAGAVLLEMAGGSTPTYGDGVSDPTVVADEARLTEEMFDGSVAPALVAFFRRALAREAGARFHTAGDMLAAWKAAIKPVPRTATADAVSLAQAAQPATRLAEAGLSPRALSAVEPLGVITVADLIAVDPVRLSRLGGVAEATRVELRERSRLWRERFAGTVGGRSGDADNAALSSNAGLPSPAAAADLLLARAGEANAQGRRRVARLLLGVDSGADPFASQLELASVLGVSRARVAQLVAGLHKAWAQPSETRDLLGELSSVARQALLDLGGVATADELSSAVLAALAPPDQGADRKLAGRLAAGLLRLALDRSSTLYRAHAEADLFTSRRRSGRIAILATDPALLDAADALGVAADELVNQLGPTEGIVPARRASAHLRDALARVTSGVVMRVDDTRLVRLGAGLATKAALSGAGDLHHRDLSPEIALSVALRGVGASERIRIHELKDRLRARFPALPPLPDRPRLDELVEAAGLGLVFDETEQAFRGRTQVVGTAGLESRLTTLHPTPPATSAEGEHIAERLRESRSRRSFLALGVEAPRMARALEVLRHDFDAEVLDLTRTLLDAIRAAAAAAEPPISWKAVVAADAAMPDSREATGLARLVALAIPKVDAALEAVLGGTPRGAKPLVLTEAASLARYGHLGMLSRWADLASPRAEAAWLLVPQLLGNQGAVIDGRPIPLAAPGQFLRLDAAWIDAHVRSGRADSVIAS